MKKLIIVLMVVSMSALLFTGCLPTTNTAPTITYSASQTATIGTEFISTVTATDAEGDTLTFSVSGGPAGMVIDSATGVISGWTPAAAGTETVLVSVTDGKDPSTLLVTITALSIGPAEITIEVKDEYSDTATGKTYVKGGSKEITVTFPVAVENPVVEVGTVVVPIFTVDSKVYKGTHKFDVDGAVLIKVSGACDEDLCAAKSVIVDSLGPVVELKAEAATCDCEDSYALTITSVQEACDGCVADDDCCEDKGSGIASWNVKIFDADPWKVPTADPCEPPDCEPCCSDDPCIDPIAELDGTACPITITTECIDKVWAEVDGEDKWVDYFDGYYWVIATLTDNVGNETIYYGIVTPSTDKTKNYVYNFAEIHHPTDETWCWCYAEDWYAADSVLGDCDGLPATECWEEPLNPCPEITLDPEVPVIGEEVTITIDYTLAEKPDGTVSAYVGPAFKTLPLGVPEGSSALPLEKDGDVYEATVVFGEAGDRIIYVVDGCGDCPPCTENITILPVGCPEITIANEVEYPEGSGVWWISEFDREDVGTGSHEITVAFAAPVVGVRVFVVEDSYDWEGGAIIPDDAVEISMTTEDGMTYTGEPGEDNASGSNDVFDAGGPDCDEEWIYVLFGESHSPVVCSRTVMIDDEEPCLELAAKAFVECTDCDEAYEVWITSDTCAYTEDADECCGPLDCGDNCTTFDWTLTVYAAVLEQPFEEDCDDCVLDDCAEEVGTWTGTGCPVDVNVFGCLTEEEWDEQAGGHFVVLEVEDIVGNSRTCLGVLWLNPNSFGGAFLNDAVWDDGGCELVLIPGTPDDVLDGCCNGRQDE